MIPLGRKGCPALLLTEPKWRNWQTRQVQDLVPVKGVEVRVLSSAPCHERSYGESCRRPFPFPRSVWGNCGEDPPLTLRSRCPGRRQPMAALELRNKTYRVVFMYAGKKYAYSLDTGDRDMAEALRGGVEKTLMLLAQGLLNLPSGADLIAFVKAGGKVEEPPAPPPERLSLKKLTDSYLQSHANGAMEENSLATTRLHLGHFLNTLGQRFDVQDLAL